jgi:uncharacterized membrane protein
MDLRRFWRHVLMSPIRAAAAFPSTTLDAIQREIAAHEQLHRGEVCFVVEAELETSRLWADLSSRDRAREVFALRGVWNTEENNGVLIYVLLADHKVEIVADRGIDARVGAEAWARIVAHIERYFAERRFEEGAIAGVRAVSDLLAMHFPPIGEGKNELADRPVMM